MGYEINNLYRASYLELPKNKSRAKTSREIEGAFTVIRSLLFLRIIFTYFEILPSFLERAVSTVSYPLVAPFYLVLGISPENIKFDAVSIFAIAIYTITGYILSRLFRASIVSAPAEEIEN